MFRQLAAAMIESVTDIFMQLFK